MRRARARRRGVQFGLAFALAAAALAVLGRLGALGPRERGPITARWAAGLVLGVAAGGLASGALLALTLGARSGGGGGGSAGRHRDPAV